MRLNSFHQKARLSAASAIDQLRSLLAKSADGTVTHQLDLSELEDRILLSASPAAVMVEPVSAPDSVEVASPLEGESASLFETVTAGSSDESGESIDAAQPAAFLNDAESSGQSESAQFESASQTDTPLQQTPTEVVFVDDSTADIEQLIADLQTQRDAGRAVDFFVLDSQADGIDQIAETLQRYSDLDAVHIVSHGSNGAVKLGATWLRIGSLDGYAGTIAGWGNAFSTDGDLLFYGCDLAESSRGELLVDSISALIGADVAASTDNTGSALLGGDWELEFETGTIEAETAFTAEVQHRWNELLAVPAVDSASSGSTMNQLSATVSHTTAGTNRLMLVGISMGPHGESVSSVTYNGVNLTLVGFEEQGGANARVEIWELVAPDTGTHDVVVNLTGTEHKGVVVGVTTFTGVDQTTPTLAFSSDFGSSATASTTVASAADGLVFGIVASHKGTSAAPESGQTEYWDIAVENMNGSGTVEAGAPSVTASWTVRDDQWAAAAVSIRANVVTANLAPVDEFRVNTTTGNTQETSNEDRGSSRAVAIAPNGEYVVVWSSNQMTGGDGDGFSVLMQRFDAAGNTIGPERQVNQNTMNDQFHASVAMDDSGRGVVVWTDTDGSNEVMSRLFHADGTFNGNEFMANTATGGDQDNPAVAMDASGNFVIVWEGNGPTDIEGIHAQRFDANGTKVGIDFTVNVTKAGTQSEPSIAMNSSGQFVVVWDDGGGVHARTYESDGTGGSGSQFNVDGGSSAGDADVGIDDAGRAVIVWRETNGLFGKGVYHRAFDFGGSALTGDGIVNSQVFDDQTNPSITIDSVGNHIVAWEGAGFTDSTGVMYQKYDSSFAKVGGETAINQTTSNTQDQVSLAMLDSDNFVVVWSGEGPGDPSGVFARQYGTATPSNSDPTADAGGPYAINEGDALNLDGSASSDPDTDPLTFAWDLDNDGNFGEPGEPTTEAPTVSWATLVGFGITDDPGSPFTIGLQVGDGNGGVNTTTTTLTISNVAPTGNPGQRRSLYDR